MLRSAVSLLIALFFASCPAPVQEEGEGREGEGDAPEGEGEGPVAEGEGEGEGPVAEGEGEGPVAEGEGEGPSAGEGEGEGPTEGEGEGPSACEVAGVDAAGSCGDFGGLQRCVADEVESEFCPIQSACRTDADGAQCLPQWLILLDRENPVFLCSFGGRIRLGGGVASVQPQVGPQGNGTYTLPAVLDVNTAAGLSISIPSASINETVVESRLQRGLLVEVKMAPTNRVCRALLYDQDDGIEATFRACLSDREPGLFAERTEVDFDADGSVFWEETTTYAAPIDDVDVFSYQGVYVIEPDGHFVAGSADDNFGFTGFINASGELFVDQWGDDGAFCF